MADGALDDKELEDLLDSTLEEFSDETQAAGKDGNGGDGEGEIDPAVREERNREAIKADVSGKFNALMAIFQSDVKLEEEYLKEFQALSRKQLELLNKACDEGKCTSAVGFAGGDDDDDALSKAVKETVEILKSGQAAGGGAQGNLSDEDVMKKFTEQLQGLDSDPSMQGVMESMMQQILSKEFLHEPLTEIANKYPAWLEENRATLAPEELDRYTRQLGVMRKICEAYEKQPEDMEEIVRLMQEMQLCGQPPADIVKELGSGLEVDENGMPKLPPGAEGCNVM